MGKISISFVLVLLAAVAAAAPGARDDSAGVGIVAGEPTGLCFKAWVGGQGAVDAAAGWSLGESGQLYLHVDYLHHRYDLDPEDFRGTIPYYFGVGCRLLLFEDDDSKVGIRLPLGIDYIFSESPFDVFVEIAPVLNLVPETEFDWSGGVGARFWF